MALSAECWHCLVFSTIASHANQACCKQVSVEILPASIYVFSRVATGNSLSSLYPLGAREFTKLLTRGLLISAVLPVALHAFTPGVRCLAARSLASPAPEVWVAPQLLRNLIQEGLRRWQQSKIKSHQKSSSQTTLRRTGAV